MPALVTNPLSVDQDFAAGITHLDLWIGQPVDSGLSCEQSFGVIHHQTIIQNPPPGLPVNFVALWDGNACHDKNSANPAVFPNPNIAGLCLGREASSASTSTSVIAGSSPVHVLEKVATPIPTLSYSPVTTAGSAGGSSTTLLT